MLRKVLKIFLIIVGIGFLSAFVRGYKHYSNDEKINNSSISSEKQNLIDEEIISSILNVEDNINTDEVISTTEIEETYTNEIQEEQKVSNPINEVEEIKDTIEENKTLETTEEKEVQNNSINEETNNNNNNSNDNIKIYEIVIPEPEVDEEYIKVQEYVDYKADEYNLCNSKSIEVGVSDTKNIDYTSCEHITYKGTLVGYKIKIFYVDGTSGYYNN